MLIHQPALQKSQQIAATRNVQTYPTDNLLTPQLRGQAWP
jgi:hypothetical protein